MHLAPLCQLGSEVVENVRCGTETGKQDNWPARAAPIKHFQPHTCAHGYELNGVWRGITPACGILAWQ